MYEGPEFRHLRYFVAVAEECSFGRAAQRLHVTQPALSIQIKQLEVGLNAPLFFRTPAGVALTNAGKTLLPLAKQLIAMRSRAVEHTSQAHHGNDLPFRFGYSPWLNHGVVHEAISGYKEMVPGGEIEPSSRSSALLATHVASGSLDAALIYLPVRESDIMVQSICTEKLLVCLRTDDPLTAHNSVPKQALEKRLKVMFDPQMHPLLFEQIERKLARAGIHLRPSEFVPHPADLQFLVKEKAGLGLVPQGARLDPELILRPLDGIHLTVETAFICHELQQRPVLPLLAYRIAKCCAESTAENRRKKPVARIESNSGGQAEMFG